MSADVYLYYVEVWMYMRVTSAFRCVLELAFLNLFKKYLVT